MSHISYHLLEIQTAYSVSPGLPVIVKNNCISPWQQRAYCKNCKSNLEQVKMPICTHKIYFLKFYSHKKHTKIGYRRKETIYNVVQPCTKYLRKIDSLQNFLLLSLSLVTAPIDFLPEIYFIFRKKVPGPNLKVFPYRIWTSVKRSEEQLSSKTKFSYFLQVNCSNFTLQLC